jgi:hypothetical protein
MRIPNPDDLEPIERASRDELQTLQRGLEREETEYGRQEERLRLIFLQ